MTALDPDLRNLLDRAVVSARESAELAATAALERLAVGQNKPFATHSDAQRELRVVLREKARQLGDRDMQRGLRLLAEEVAFEQWHRMLFARFLAENQLLMHPDGVAVTLQECADLAAEQGEMDGWALTVRYAAEMLPGIFGIDDPRMDVPLAREGHEALESILESLPSDVFTSDDGLGWVYQFWQSKRKKEVSSAGRKIEGLDLAAYSQLFTEDYMVRFLLENSLGAWWATRHPGSPLLDDLQYLRRLEDGAPATGTFVNWPQRASEVRFMDPCCGSGHFLVTAFEMLRRMRMEEEGLSDREAGDAVLRDNLFGLELDPRCVQIAAFGLALAAWKCGGYRPLPLPNLACSGTPLRGSVDEWTRLAGDDADLRHALERLHGLFRDAPEVGSLIDPGYVSLQDRMFNPDFEKISPLLGDALATATATEDPVAAVFGEIAEGAVRAADMLSRTYTLVATNVPYLTRNKQGETLRSLLASQYSKSKDDIATAFLERCVAFLEAGGVAAVVTPQNWLFLRSYRALREHYLEATTWRWVSRLGPGAFETITGEVVRPALIILDEQTPGADQSLFGIDTDDASTPSEKAYWLREQPPVEVPQARQRQHPDARVVLTALATGPTLELHADSHQGISTGDNPRFQRFFWELPSIDGRWRRSQGPVEQTKPFGGLEHILDWADDGRELAAIRGRSAWGRSGLAVTQMGQLPVATYLGGLFDTNMAALVPKNPEHLPALWAYLTSDEYREAVFALDAKLNVTNATLVKVPFDLPEWLAEAEHHDSLPSPSSNDPTQWLFKGDPFESTEPLQVAVARLLGYRWPDQTDDALCALVDEDGLLPLIPVGGEEPAAERLRSALATAYGAEWTAAVQEELLLNAGFGGKGLDAWLVDGFFEQHMQVFQQRPFIWHIWDGRRDGFGVLANYHMLDTARLNRLIYTHLGSWIGAQRADRDAGIAGADARLVAALALQEKLEAIRDGEPRYDIYVRWKSLAEQPIGWDPDLNDGVRLNIRPFIEAGVLRRRVNVKWNKDRGLNPDGSDRLNDCHYSVAKKRAAKEGAGT